MHALLCLAMAGLWVRSYWVSDKYKMGRGHGYIVGEAMWGRLILTKVSIGDELWDLLKPSVHPGTSHLVQQPGDPYRAIGAGMNLAWDVGGLQYGVNDAAAQKLMRERVLIIPIWMINVPF